MNCSYIEGASKLHRMHPAAKLIILLLLVAASLIFSAAVNGAAAVLLILAWLASGTGFRRLLGLLKPLPLFVAIIIAANLFLARSGEPYGADILQGIFQGLRVLVLLLSAGLFGAVTDPARLSAAVAAYGSPFKAIGIEREDLALMLMIIFSFIPLAGQEVDRIRKARTVRCGRGGYLSMKRGGVLPLILPLTASVVRRGNELELALAARHYGKGGKIEGERMPAAEIAVTAAFLVIFILGLYAKF